MKLQGVRAIAKQYQINSSVLSEPGLIHEIKQQEPAIRAGFDAHSRPLQPSGIRAMQRQHGEEPCFSTDKRYSCTEPCEWRKECVKLRAVWLR